MLQIFIPSYNRAGNTRTTALLDRAGITNYKVVVRPSQYSAYAEHLNKRNLLILDAEEGLSYAREFVRKQVRRGDWCLHMDDNVQGFYVANEEFYRAYEHFERGPGGLTEINRRWDHIIRGPNTDFTQFYRVAVTDTMHEAEKRGAMLCGFTAQQSSSMRGPHKWCDVKYVCGKVMLMKNVGFPWRHITVSTGEDYALTAAHLLKFGRVLVNNWATPRRRHYMPGGCGTREERLPEMVRTSAELMRRYPGLFREKTAGPKGVESTEGELRLRLHTLEQVAAWRANFPKGADRWEAR
jgi:TET-Associated Glycosyltransferase